jgi:hypothetical protein
MGGGRRLRTWMTVVGVIYLAMGLRLLPWINGAMIEAGLGDVAAPGIELVPGTVFFEFAVDWMGVFGLDLVVLGAVLLVAARTPHEHRILAHVVIWQEAIRGIVADGWLMTRSYASAGSYLGFMVFHAVVILTGIGALRAEAPDRIRVEVAP